MVNKLTFKIASAKKEDMKACEWLGKFKEFREASGDYVNANFLSYYLSKDFFLVIKRGRELVGYLVAEKLKAGGAVIWYLAVKPKYREQGLGHELMIEFEKRCRQNKVEWILLHALKNKVTLKFYRSLGFSGGEQEQEFIKLMNVKKIKDIKL